ncbi:hypothetical protein DUI87_16880 [Hirundo rustica rustica]|uniref:Uncharacterized protein n=1 Tax=Hirundo rustica rustica TaxID=333673 RepID=A0A3M0K2C9_HIRRU|nr:hypothetical protein DUI87_16880 [Hirundo rustica rustica]
MGIHIKVIFPETWNGELVIEEHIQTRSNPKEESFVTKIAVEKVLSRLGTPIKVGFPSKKKTLVKGSLKPFEKAREAKPDFGDRMKTMKRQAEKLAKSHLDIR